MDVTVTQYMLLMHIKQFPDSIQYDHHKLTCIIIGSCKTQHCQNPCSLRYDSTISDGHQTTKQDIAPNQRTWNLCVRLCSKQCIRGWEMTICDQLFLICLQIESKDTLYNIHKTDLLSAALRQILVMISVFHLLVILKVAHFGVHIIAASAAKSMAYL